MRALKFWFVVVVVLGMFGTVQAGSPGTLRASMSDGEIQANDWSLAPDLSAGGRFVAFESYATNLVPGDVDGVVDVFVRDLVAKTTELVSVGWNEVPADGVSSRPSISADGRYVAFQSRATNLVASDENDAYDVFVRDRFQRITRLVSAPLSGPAQFGRSSFEPEISADGRFIVFATAATNLVPGVQFPSNTVQVVRRDLVSGTFAIASGGNGEPGDASSHEPAVSDDGRFIAFWSEATNLQSAVTPGRFPQVYRRDMLRPVDDPSAIQMASVGSMARTALPGVDTNRIGDSIPDPDVTPEIAASNRGSFDPAISGDGMVVAFRSESDNLVCGDGNGIADVFVRDWNGPGFTELISRPSPTAQYLSDKAFDLGADDGSYAPSLSDDGRFVAFNSDASNVVEGDTNGKSDVFVYDRALHLATRVSVDATEGQATDWSFDPSLAAAGDVVAFVSMAPLVAGDNNRATDVFVRTAGGPLVDPPHTLSGSVVAWCIDPEE